MSDTIAIVLAAGKGTRMRSRLPKVAHQVGGRPMILHVHHAVMGLENVQPLYVLGHDHQTVRDLLPDEVQIVLQTEQLGTGHAVRTAIPALADDCREVLVLYGDMPLLTTETLASLRTHHQTRNAKLTVLSAYLQEPFGYGRLVRDSAGRPLRIVEQKELTEDLLALEEINTGVYVMDARWLRQAIAAMPRHADGEFYLTDLVEQAAGEDGLEVMTDATPEEVLGINDRRQLAFAERVMRERTNERLLREGVTLIDPTSAYIAADATIGADTIVEPNVWIGYGVTIGERCHIGSNSRIVASALGDDCTIVASVIEYAELESKVTVGPFSHLRAGASLSGGVHVGNFAEIKNSTIGAASKIGHFSYVGDTTVGTDVNIGAGTVTVNYDGRSKFRTTIGDRAFVGSGTMLRAPVTLGAGSSTGAGSVVLRDVAPGVTVVGVPARPLNGLDAQQDAQS